jgi:hypothetical protein
MISNLCYELHQGDLFWFWGFASEIELARWGAVNPAKSLVGLTLVPVTGSSTSPYRRPLHTKRKSGFWGTLWWLETGKGRISCICCRMHCTSLSKPVLSTSQAATLSSSNSALLLPIEHANAFQHQGIHLLQYSELGVCSLTGLNLHMT